MVARRDQFWVVEAAGCNVDLVWKIGVLKRELCPTPRTERAYAFCGRVEPRRVAFDDTKIQ
jgi:hypothetical protein